MKTKKLKPGVYQTDNGLWIIEKTPEGYHVIDTADMARQGCGPFKLKRLAMDWCSANSGKAQLPAEGGDTVTHRARGKLKRYAPGDGTLRFSYCGVGKFEDEAVDSPRTIDEIPTELRMSGWLLTLMDGEVLLYKPCTRLGLDEIEMDSERYQYGVEWESDDRQHRRYWFKFDHRGHRCELKNLSMIASLSWWLDHEAQL